MAVLEETQEDHQSQINWLGTMDICTRICFNPGDVRYVIDYRISDIVIWIQSLVIKTI